MGMGICVTCGQRAWILDNFMCQDCYFSERAFQDRHPAPLADGDEYMILNHYGLA